jgi:hypothetical protein
MTWFLLTRIPEKTSAWNFYNDEQTKKFRGRFPSGKAPDVEFYEGTEHQSPWIILQDVTQEQAEEVAIMLASKRPGVTWYVSEIKGGAVAPAAAPVKLSIGDKGVLPA